MSTAARLILPALYIRSKLFKGSVTHSDLFVNIFRVLYYLQETVSFHFIVSSFLR
ncbi:hypothetical protein HMPREF0372_01755 [Flavonifractor plautii ATCC 29863]|uniref:Uncharacterized protein n=1 Tax=Flavonifractor plautii ATCC 29863 TaxID=411475 RepID=G9YQG2_FLAPL|nr:hypothetical protein HMPREF0372_01755 [Flavonifractor plautii ATCC 29863]